PVRDVISRRIFRGELLVRNKCLRFGHFVGLVCGLAMISAVGTAPAQLWKQFVPSTKRGDSSTGDFALSEDSGPWLIMAASFNGDGAEQQASDLARELRERYHMRSYVDQKAFDFSGESPGRGLDEYGAPVRRRYQRGDHVQEYAVLVGDFPTID